MATAATKSSPWSSGLPQPHTQTDQDHSVKGPGVRKRVKGQWGPASKRRKGATQPKPQADTRPDRQTEQSTGESLPFTITSVRSLAEEPGDEPVELLTSTGGEWDGQQASYCPSDHDSNDGIPADAEVINLDD